jgi:hypothetical protein
MIVQLGEFLQKCAIVSGCSVAVGMLGFYVPLLFDRDVGSALAASVLKIVGLIVGVLSGLLLSADDLTKATDSAVGRYRAWNSLDY